MFYLALCFDDAGEYNNIFGNVEKAKAWSGPTPSR